MQILKETKFNFVNKFNLIENACKNAIEATNKATGGGRTNQGKFPYIWKRRKCLKITNIILILICKLQKDMFS